MNKILELLQAKSEDEALAILQSLASPPVSITVVMGRTGGVHISSTGPMTPELANHMLFEAMRAFAQLRRPEPNGSGAQEKDKQTDPKAEPKAAD
jgi:hypothetical protein